MWGQVTLSCDVTFPHPFLALAMLYADLGGSLEGSFHLQCYPSFPVFPKEDQKVSKDRDLKAWGFDFP